LTADRTFFVALDATRSTGHTVRGWLVRLPISLIDNVPACLGAILAHLL
jgi:hypothetical protein